MKLQTSIEFIAILSAVVAFAVFALGIYLHLATAQNRAFNSITRLGLENAVVAGNQTAGTDLQISMSLPPFSYVNRTNTAYVMVILPAGDGIETLTVNATPFTATDPSSFRNVSGNGLAVLSLSYLPTSIGQLTLRLKALVTNLNGANDIEENYSTQVIYSNRNQSANLTDSALRASITTYNQSAVYNLSAPQNASGYRTWQHCPYHGWLWGNILPESSQCGGSTWGFIINGNCDQQRAVGWDMYVCVAQNSTNMTDRSISQRYGRNYSISLTIYNSSLKLRSNLSKSSDSGPLVNGDGVDYGNVLVSSVSGDGYLPEPYGTSVLLQDRSGFYLVNESYYSNYSSIHRRTFESRGIASSRRSG